MVAMTTGAVVKDTPVHPEAFLAPRTVQPALQNKQKRQQNEEKLKQGTQCLSMLTAFLSHCV